MAVSGFFSVAARFSGRVVCRVGARGVVWAWRAPRAGERPSPACLFIGARTRSRASAYCAVARSLGWVAELRAGTGCAVWSSGPLAAGAPPFACKVRLPSGVSACAARSALRAAWGRLTW